MFLIGLLSGIVVAAAVGVFLLGIGWATVGEVDEILESSATPTPTEAVASLSPGDVPDSCVRASEYSLAVDEGLDDIATGLRDEDALTLQEALDSVQNARDTADGAAEECLAIAEGGSR